LVLIINSFQASQTLKYVALA